MLEVIESPFQIHLDEKVVLVHHLRNVHHAARCKKSFNGLPPWHSAELSKERAPQRLQSRHEDGAEDLLQNLEQEDRANGVRCLSAGPWGSGRRPRG